MAMSQIFWVGFYTSLMGFLLAIGNTLYKSKCKTVECCCIKIIRDVELEEKEMEFVSTHTPNNHI